MAFGRIPTPVDDEVCPVFDFAESACDLATQLGGYLSGAVSKRGVAVDHTSNHLAQCDGLTLRLARDVAEPVHERHVRVVQVVGGRFNRVVKTRFLAVNERVGIGVLRGVIAEPGLAKAARVLRLDDAIALDMEFHVVADTSAERAGRVLDNRQAHR